MKIVVSGGQFFADGFAVRRAFELWEGEERRISFLSERGSGCATLRLKEGVPVADSPCLKLVDRKKGWQILPDPLPPAGRLFTECALSVGEKRFVATCSGGNLSRLSLSGAFSGEIELRERVFDPKITLLSGQRDPLLSLQASTAEGEYLLILSLGAEGITVLLECSGESILCRGNEVTVKKSFDDLRLRRVTRRYLWRGTGFDSSQEIASTREHAFIREESGRALMEAVFAGDEKGALALLSPEIADYAAIREYFGDLRSLSPALFCESPTAYAAIKRTGGRWIAVTYDFDFDERGRISNLRCDE